MLLWIHKVMCTQVACSALVAGDMTSSYNQWCSLMNECIVLYYLLLGLANFIH